MSLISPQLQAFIAVAHRGTVQQAALDLRITQTGVTQRLKTLEAQLHTAMFERSRKGMRLTAEGQALLLYCQRVLEMEGEVLAQIEGKPDKSKTTIQRIAIAGPSSMMRARIIPTCARLASKQPQLRLSFQIDDRIESVKEKLRRGEMNIGVLPLESIPNELDRKKLKAETYVLALPYAWRKRSLSDIVRTETIIDFDDDDRMTYEYLKSQGLLQDARPERHFANNTDALASMIAAGLGYSLMARDLTKSLVKDQLIFTKGEAQSLDFALCWYPRPEVPPYFRSILDGII